MSKPCEACWYAAAALLVMPSLVKPSRRGRSWLDRWAWRDYCGSLTSAPGVGAAVCTKGWLTLAQVGWLHILTSQPLAEPFVIVAFFGGEVTGSYITGAFAIVHLLHITTW
jgi:hypothetical protein